MLIRYRAYANITLQNFRDDINSIIVGNVTSNADITPNLSAGANKGAIEVYGTYPVGIYQRANLDNKPTYTYSKNHNAVAGYTHYIRLSYDHLAANTAGNIILMANVALAQSYTSATDTLVNSYTYTGANIRPSPYSATTDKSTLDIIISPSQLTFISPSSGTSSRYATYLSVVDMGHSSVSRTYANSMLMCLQDYTNVPNYGTSGNTGGVIPYYYSYTSFSYGSVASMTVQSVSQASKKFFSNTTSIVFENPVFTVNTEVGAQNLLYGTFRTSQAAFGSLMIYKNSANAYRLSVNDMVFLSE